MSRIERLNKILNSEEDKTAENSLNIIDYLRNNLSAKSYFRSQRLSSILNKVNRGNPYHDEKGKFTFSPGNHNPGKGRDVGNPSKKISYEEYVKKFKKSTKTERKELDKKYPEYADKYFDELMGRHLKTLKKEREQKELEEKFKNYENDNSHPHFDLDNMVYEYKDALDITPDEYNGAWNDETKSFEKLKNLKEYYNKVKGIQVKIISMNPSDYSHTIIDNDDEYYTSMSAVIDRTSKKGIDMYKEKFNNGERVEIPYIKFNENGKFSGEQEGFHRTLAANEIGDSEVPVAIVTKYYGKQPKLNYGRDITKKVEEYFANKKENNSRMNRLVNLENRINNRKNSENILNKTSGNPYHDKFGRFTSCSSSTSSYYYDSDTTLGDKTKSGDITKEIKSFKDFKDKLSEVTETYNSYDIKGQEVWVHPDSKLFKKIESPVTDKNTLKLRKDEIERENKSPFVLVSTYNNKDVIIDGNHVAAAYRELSEEGKNYLVPVLYVKKEEIERYEKEHPDYHSKEKTYTKTKLIDE